MDTKELYRGFEIYADLAGYGFYATQPDFDLGMPCLHDWTVEKVKAEVDCWVEDNAPEPVPELRAIDCTTTKQWEQWAAERREYDDPCGQNRSRY